MSDMEKLMHQLGMLKGMTAGRALVIHAFKTGNKDMIKNLYEQWGLGQFGEMFDSMSDEHFKDVAESVLKMLGATDDEPPLTVPTHATDGVYVDPMKFVRTDMDGKEVYTAYGFIVRLSVDPADPRRGLKTVAISQDEAASLASLAPDKIFETLKRASKYYKLAQEYGGVFLIDKWIPLAGRSEI